MKAIFIPNSLYMEFMNIKESNLKFLAVASLSRILSPPDVAFYIKCNQNPQFCLPEPIVKSFEFINFEPDVYKLETGGVDNAILSRLQKLESKNLSADLDDEKSKMLTCDILEGDVILFTYIDKPENSSQEEGDLELYDRLITQMCALSSFRSVAKLPIFKAYLEAKQNDIFKH